MLTTTMKPLMPTRSGTVEQRSVARPMLAIAVMLTIAWFAAAAIAISPHTTSSTVSGYGIDDIARAQQLAQRR